MKKIQQKLTFSILFFLAITCGATVGHTLLRIYRDFNSPLQVHTAGSRVIHSRVYLTSSTEYIIFEIDLPSEGNLFPLTNQSEYETYLNDLPYKKDWMEQFILVWGGNTLYPGREWNTSKDIPFGEEVEMVLYQGTRYIYKYPGAARQFLYFELPDLNVYSAESLKNGSVDIEIQGVLLQP